MMTKKIVEISRKNRRDFGYEFDHITCCICGDPFPRTDKFNIVFLNEHTNKDDPAHLECYERSEAQKKAVAENLASFACKLAQELRHKYGLTYGCSVNLEGTINNMIHYGMGEEPIKDILTDLLDNVDFVETQDDFGSVGMGSKQ